MIDSAVEEMLNLTKGAQSSSENGDRIKEL